MQVKTLDLSYVYDLGTSEENMALNHVSLDLLPKGIIALAGHTGSGKTTFIKTLNALIFPTTGQVCVGENIILPRKKPHKRVKDIDKYRKDIGFVFQFPEEQIFEETVAKEILFGLKIRKLSSDQDDEKVEKYLQIVGLDSSFKNRNPFELSGGEKRRVALASILITEPKLLIFDEPTASLDNEAVRHFYQNLVLLSASGISIIVVTHELKNILEFANHMVLFADGQIVAQGDPLEILYNANLLEQNLLEIPKLAKLTLALNAKGIKIPPTRSIDEFVIAYKRLRGKND